MWFQRACWKCGSRRSRTDWDQSPSIVYTVSLPAAHPDGIQKLTEVAEEDKKRGRTATYTPNQLVQYDIVLVTYEKLQLDAKAYRETRDEFVARHGSTTYWNDPIRCNSTLSVVKWHVIVLEEGHRIVNGESKTTAAACGLRGQYRLALTGTPFQNEYSDFQSLYRFLQIPPWDKVSNFNRVRCAPCDHEK